MSVKRDLAAILAELRAIRRQERKYHALPRYHVHPIKEPDHLLHGTRCWCGPQVCVSDDGEREVIRHHRAQ